MQLPRRRFVVVGALSGLAACRPVPPTPIPPQSPTPSASPSATAAAPSAVASPTPTPTPSPQAAPGSTTAPSPTETVAPEPTPSPGVTATGNPFDAHYDRSFKLTSLSADPVQQTPTPRLATSLEDARIDSAYGTRIYRATVPDSSTGARLRHHYSRSQAFNADNSRFMAEAENGHWSLHDANTFEKLEVLPRLAGNCEPLWDPKDPTRYIHTGRDGGMQWWDQDGKVVFDFTGRTPWPQATSFWTGGEGTRSADGRILTLMANAYDETTKQKVCHGIVTVDLSTGTILGTLDASRFPFPGAVPDHVSTSPSGRFAVVSWVWMEQIEDGGTFAYPVDFSSSRKLIGTSEHSDLAIGANGHDLYVAAAYRNDDGAAIIAVDLETGERSELHRLYLPDSESYACHISAQCFDRPGWAVVSTYGEHRVENGTLVRATTVQPEYRKVWLLELKPGGRALNVAHIHSTWPTTPGENKHYFLEPQATASKDLSRIMVAANHDGGDASSYMIGLPSWVLD
ncbi:hypothetical protein EII34_02410 [Arachnia propionica]|uniref:Uncharacterized protein n=1 Tax=Arachnia propionica TaxID=1750 RepID=A0A3P1TEL5_9ACTN|nr:hypothetical protein [Arachnia propionica]RRD07356.1 hypothetical protein EII34_02410 [Arachnia propionica]